MYYAHQSAKAVKVFYSYSHKDEELRNEMENHLAMLKREGIIESWHDRRIEAGNKWAGEINERLNTADIILLLVSSDFLASDYCNDVEVKRAMERHEAGHARVIPIILRACHWKSSPFDKLQALPRNALPVKNWSDLDAAFLDAATGIRKAAEEIIASRHGEKNPRRNAPRYVKRRANPQQLDSILCLCDRNEQLTDLEKEIKEHRSNRPFICVIHGNERERPDMFIQRLLDRSLPRILNLKKGQSLNNPYLMAWPSRYKPSPDPLDSFRGRLGRMLTGDSQASREQMAQTLAKEKLPVVIRTNLRTRYWKPAGRKLIESFIECWSEWPELKSGQILIVCISFHYEQGKQRGLWRWLRWAKHNKEVRRFFDRLKFKEHYRLPGVVLTELGAINRNDVEQLIHEHARKLQGDAVNLDDFKAAIQSLYAKRDFIEMEELVEHFEKVRAQKRKDD